MILEYDRIKEQEMKDKLRNGYFRRTKLILKSTLNGRIKIITLNTWAASIMRYELEYLSEIRINCEKWSKYMTMNKELHPRSDVAWLYVSRKNGGKGLTGCKNSVKSEQKGLG